MTGKIKAPKRKYESQEPHIAEDCHINDAPHNHPDMDCGHYVASGPRISNGSGRSYGWDG